VRCLPGGIDAPPRGEGGSDTAVSLLTNLAAGVAYAALAAVPAGIALYATRNLEKPGARSLVATGLCTAAATVVQGLRFAEAAVSVGPWPGIALHIALLAAINLAVLGTFSLAVEYTGRRWLADRRLVLALGAPGLLLPVARILTEAAGAGAAGAVADLDFLYRLLLAVGGLSLFARQVVGSRGIYRKQSGALLIGLAVGAGLGLVERYYTLAFVEFTLLGMIVGLGVLARALFRYEFLETVPIARETLFDQVTDPVVALDGDGQVVDRNRAADDAFGLSASILGKDRGELFHAHPSLAAEYSGVLGTKEIAGVVSRDRRHFDQEHATVATLAGGNSGEGDSVTDGGAERLQAGASGGTFGVLQDGDVRYYQVSASALAFAPGYEGKLLVFRDVTASKEREQDLDILKQVLTRVLRHNLRNDATAIQGFAQSIADTGEDGTREKAERIVALTEKLTATSETARRIEDVIDADRPAEFDLRRQIETVVDDVGAKHPGAAIEWQVPEGLAVVANPELPAALTEVVENAVVHSGASPRVEITGARSGRWVDLTVVDDGPGVPAYELETIAQGEETALVHGSGAGLWLIQTAVEDSNGDVTYESSENGTTVRIRLPAAEE